MANGTIGRRQLLLGMGASTAFMALGNRALAQSNGNFLGMSTTDFDPETLVWDAAQAKKIWNARPPQFVLQTDFDMAYEGLRRPAYDKPLTPAQTTLIQDTLAACAAFYKARGFGPPTLPVADGAFHIFFVTNMPSVNGAYGGMRGSLVGADPWMTVPGVELKSNLGFLSAASNMVDVVPQGQHLVLNAENFFAPDPSHIWEPRGTLAHELLHSLDIGEATESLNNALTEDTVGNWFSEGNVESVAPFALAALNYDPMAAWKTGARVFAQNVGMRPYDYPLSLKFVPPRRPAWVRNGSPLQAGAKEHEAAASFWKYNATYFTSSFWRYILKEVAPYKPAGKMVPVPGNFELLRLLRKMEVTAADLQAVADNRDLDAGIPVLDRFLRAHHPTWGATGLHRAFPAFIAHWIEWPDQDVKSRNGLYAHQKWLDTIFMDGAKQHELLPDKPLTFELLVLPLAAKAVQFEVPNVSFVGNDYPPVAITVSVIDGHGQANPIDNIHVGLRGQCLPNMPSSRRYGTERIRRWPSEKATPLKRGATGGRTVLSFINVAPNPASTKPVRIRVEIAAQVASSNGQCSYHPLPVLDKKGDPVPLPPSVAPKGDPVTQATPVGQTSDKLTVTILQDADIVRMMNAPLSMAELMAVERIADEPKTDLTQLALSANFVGKYGPGGKGALTIELNLPRIEPGYSGPVAKGIAIATWREPRYEAFAQYNVSPQVSIETDAVQVFVICTEGGILNGSYTADFNAGSQNSEGIFRGRIEGKFQVIIAKDEAEEDAQWPEDKTAVLPTDFFVSAGRAGMDQKQLAAHLDEAYANMEADIGSGGGGPSGGGGEAGSGNGASAGPAYIDPENCNITKDEALFNRWFEQNFVNNPSFQGLDLTEMRAEFWNNWELTEAFICASGIQ